MNSYRPEATSESGRPETLDVVNAAESDSPFEMSDFQGFIRDRISQADEGTLATVDVIQQRVTDLRHMMMTYRFGLEEILTKIRILRDEFRYIHEYNPIEHVGSRVKSFESLLAKAARRNVPLNADAIRENIFDIAGVRVTCAFVSDIYRVRDALLQQRDLQVMEERDYIANAKPNGYKSLHLLVKVPVFLSDRSQDVVVEIQLRTIAMDFWASLEHKIYYKYDKEVPRHLTDALKLAADVAWTLDTTMEDIHKQMQEFRLADPAPGEHESSATFQEMFSIYLRELGVPDPDTPRTD